MAGAVATGPEAVPASDTAVGLEAAFEAIFRVAENEPLAAGEKVTPMLQLAPTATLLPHELAAEKTEGSCPARLMPEILSAALPELVTVTAC
jgi:hypothetical protein